MRPLHYIPVVLLLLLHTVLQGQDIHYSQFAQSALQVNPADAGMFPADLRITGHHKRQWASITVPYKTFSMAADGKVAAINEKFKGFGVGLLVHHDEAGDGQLRSLDVRLFIAYRIPLNTDSVHFFRGGFMGGFSQRTIDFNKLTFDEQFDGDVFNPLSPNGETFNSNSSSWADMGFGLGWDMQQENSLWQAGFSATHINRPDQGFFTEEVRRPVLWQINTGGQLKLNESMLLLPGAIYMLQEEFREFNFGAELKVNLQQEKQQPYAIGFGIHHRWKDALIPSVALYMGKFRLGFSYDINTSPLKTVSRSRGGPEISIVYMSRKIKPIVQRSIICPVY